MKTRILFTIACTLFLASSVLAQGQDEEMKLLFQKKDKSENEKIANGGYGAMTFGWTQIEGKSAIIMGAQFAWIANHHFGLGLAGRGFFNDFSTSANYNPSEYFLAGGYGGLMFEPIVLPMSPVHVSFPIILGVGGVTANPANGWRDYGYYYYDNYYYDTDVYFVFEPGVDVEFNIAKFFRIALGASYRLTDGINLTYKYFDEISGDIKSVAIDKNALNSFNASVSLKFGWF